MSAVSRASSSTFAAAKRSTLGRRIVPWFIAVSVILLAIVGGIYQSVTQLISASGWVEHSYQVLDTLDLTSARFVDAQSAERGYVATCSRVLLLPYRTDLPRIYSDIAYLRLMTADNPLQQQRVEKLHGALSNEFSRMSAAIAYAAQGKTQLADAAVADPKDRVDVKHILEITQEMEKEERGLLSKRIARVNFFATATLIAIGIGVLACVGILFFVFRLVRRESRQREEAQASLYQTNERLQDSLAELRVRSDAAQSIALLGELLQTCRNTGEALGLTARHIAQLFPAASGIIGLFTREHDRIEIRKAIGDEASAQDFLPDDCWALRRGRLHHFRKSDSEPHCEHLLEKMRDTYCFPLAAQGETLGVLSLGSERVDSLSDVEQQTVQTIAEQLSLALANLYLQETLRHQSLHDPLTGLFNRRYMEDALARETSRARRNKQPLSIVMLDIDHFKRFNDNHGHEGGDALLAAFGQLIARHARGEDIACRYGGEEFALILPGASLSVAADRAEELREAVKHLNLELRGKSLGPISLSAGVASFPEHGDQGTRVMAVADAALYRAKQSGRDRVERAGEPAAQGRATA